MTTELDVKRTLLQRYKTMLWVASITGNTRVDLPTELTVANMMWMCDTALCDLEALPDDKVQRWIGFIQYGCAFHGLTSVAHERDFTRPLMHALYKERGQAIPPTRSLTPST